MSEPNGTKLLDILQRRYEDRGYALHRHPGRDLLPPFMGDYSPDAIAIGPDQSIAIEIGGRPHEGQALNAARISALFQGQRKWKLELVVSDEGGRANASIVVPTKESILGVLRDAKQLVSSGHERAAFLLSWAALEAASRLASSEPRPRSISARGLIELLEGEGLVSFETGRELRVLADARNQIEHGDLSRLVTAAFVFVVTTAVGSLMPHCAAGNAASA